MDITAMSIVMNQSKVQQNVGIAIMKMAMDTNNQTAAQIAEMMSDISADPNLGNNVDFIA
ncbi:MAG: putative motility protein [Clostridiales bacterium]|nr:putative motility protein [Clostridiales bacterium]